ncbi:MAG: hypothetical protein ACLR6I_07555 [Waltera sp.]
MPWSSIRRAQEINEAYEYLKSIPASSRVVQPQEKAAGVPPPALERRVPGRTDRRKESGMDRQDQ